MHCNLILENNQATVNLINELEIIFTDMGIESMRVFSNYFILKLINKEDWNILLQRIGERSDNFILTPILEEGFYNGKIEFELWNRVNELTYPAAGDIVEENN